MEVNYATGWLAPGTLPGNVKRVLGDLFSRTVNQPILPAKAASFPNGHAANPPDSIVQSIIN